MSNLAGQHINLSNKYGCRAWMKVAYFTAYGVTHVARRFYREDMIETGKIELYTIAPDRDATFVFNEDWLGYAVPGTKVAMLAEAALNDIDSTISAAQMARFTELEFH